MIPCSWCGGKERHVIGCPAPDDAEESSVLPGVVRLQAVDDKPNHEIVGVLEQMLVAAKAGRLQVLSAVTLEGKMWHRYTVGDAGTLELVGAHHYVAQMILQEHGR